MNHEQNIPGRPSDEAIAAFTGELGPSPVEAKTVEEIPEGWSSTGIVRTDRDLFEFFNNTTYANTLDTQYGGAENWAVMKKDDSLLDIIAKDLESNETTDTQEAFNETLGHAAIDTIVASPEHKG